MHPTKFIVINYYCLIQPTFDKVVNLDQNIISLYMNFYLRRLLYIYIYIYKTKFSYKISCNLKLQLYLISFKDTNIDQWIKVLIDPSEILRIQGGEAMEVIIFAVVLCDQIWMNRNKAVWSNQLIDSVKLFNQINKVFIQHKQAWQLTLEKKEFLLMEASSPLGWIKCNFNAIVKPDKGVLKMVCRDSIGSIVVA